MNELTPIIEQIRAFASQNVPANVLESTLIIAITVLVGGVALSVLGAKMAKSAVASAVGIAGAAGGAYYAHHAGFNQLIGGAVGAVMFGLVAHLTFRIWVGVATAAVFSILALCAFGQQKMMPHLAEFDTLVTWSPTEGQQTFMVPSPDQQEAYRQRSLNEYASEFWSFATARDGNLPVNTALVGFGAAALGLFLGVVAVRWMLILATSVAGTILVTSSVATIFSQYLADSYQPFLNNPGVMGMGVGAFLVASLIIQTLLTRKARESGQEGKATS